LTLWQRLWRQPQRVWIRRASFQIHLWLGIALGLYIVMLSVTGSALGWIARNTSKPKLNYRIDAWVLHASTAWSEAHHDDRPDDVGAFLM
jgi:predicted NAD/FAD-dependent oxidoreductase